MKQNCLVIYDETDKIIEIPAIYNEIGIGSAPDNLIKFYSDSIDPYHLVIRKRGKSWFAISRGKNRFKTDGDSECKISKLVEGKKIMVGRYSIGIESTGETATKNYDDTASIPLKLNPHEKICLSIKEPLSTKAETVILSRNFITIGRDISNNIVIHDKTSSNFHAIIEKCPDGWYINDAGSTNGLYVDGRKVSGCKLHNGTRIILGKTAILCHFVEPDLKEISDGAIMLRTPGLENIFQEADIYSKSDLPVLLCGESGTGKELFARYIHEKSDRKQCPFIPVNCGAIPEQIAESLFFGHKRGAFTGAVENQEGLINAANGGTLFLDEVGELPKTIQSKLLRVLDTGSYIQVGETIVKYSNIRIISATNRNLLEMVNAGEFREDLFHRIAVIQMHLPPLRERVCDIEALARWIVEKFKRNEGWERCDGISTEAIEKLKKHNWPGNIRELKNVIHRAIIKSSGGIILPHHIEFYPVNRENKISKYSDFTDCNLIRELMETCNWKIATAARKSGIPRTTLRYKLKKLGLLQKQS